MHALSTVPPSFPKPQRVGRKCSVFRGHCCVFVLLSDVPSRVSTTLLLPHVLRSSPRPIVAVQSSASLLLFPPLLHALHASPILDAPLEKMCRASKTRQRQMCYSGGVLMVGGQAYPNLPRPLLVLFHSTNSPNPQEVKFLPEKRNEMLAMQT
ncbi:hypothetical protein E2C01_037210 [Portunus trituberculatus]|uniref:Uncharacterized protein n=1 Tax=Portunus trituberculatus TaxID=210409 RepID=A0A5B7F7I5_PORTR|nr:hypothetical protein [Portunus trituberculatus]